MLANIRVTSPADNSGARIWDQGSKKKKTFNRSNCEIFEQLAHVHCTDEFLPAEGTGGVAVHALEDGAQFGRRFGLQAEHNCQHAHPLHLRGVRRTHQVSYRAKALGGLERHSLRAEQRVVAQPGALQRGLGANARLVIGMQQGAHEGDGLLGHVPPGPMVEVVPARQDIRDHRCLPWNE